MANKTKLLTEPNIINAFHSYNEILHDSSLRFRIKKFHTHVEVEITKDQETLSSCKDKSMVKAKVSAIIKFLTKCDEEFIDEWLSEEVNKNCVTSILGACDFKKL